MHSKTALHAAALAAALLALPCQVSAATRVDIQPMDAKQVGREYKTASAGMKRAASVPQRHAEMLAMEPEAALTLQNVSQDMAGKHFRYQQTYRGLPIFGESVVVSEDAAGNPRAFFGSLVQGVSGDVLSTKANISASRALAAAKRAALGKLAGQYVVEDSTAVLSIYIDGQDRAHLAYVASFFADIPGKGQATQPTVIVDARNGRIIDRWESLASALVGTGPGGNLKSGTYEFGPTFGYLDVARSNGVCKLQNSRVRTINLNHAIWGSTVHSYACPRNEVKAINGAMAPMNDAHYFATAVYDMYDAYLGEPPIAGQVSMRIHYGLESNKAAWRGGPAPKGQTILLGDGSPDLYHPWVSLDVVSHELGHGFTDQYSKLVRVAFQQTKIAYPSSAIDESFSDMSGEAAEYFITGTNDFEFGKHVVKAAGAIRYMSDPTLDGKSIGHASKFVANLDPHYSSGVYNKAFYLLAHSAGWDTMKAFKAFAFANKNYWTSKITFNQGACGVQLAAVDLGYLEQDVIKAFAAVGVRCGMVWQTSTAIGLHGGGRPLFRDAKRTVSSTPEPANGMYGFAARTTVARRAGRRYMEFTFSRQRASTVYAYSGQTCLSLRDKALPVEGNAGMVGDWSLCWFADQDSSPAATNGPWFRSGNQVLWTHYSGPLGGWAIAEGDTVGIAADLNTGKIWFSLNGIWVGDPATGTAPNFDQQLYAADIAITGKTVVPQLYTEFQDLTVTLRGSQAQLLHNAPDGYTAWAD